MAAITSMVTVGLAVGGALYQADEARKARRATESHIARQENRAEKQRDEMKAQQETADAREEAVKDRTKKISRQKALRSESSGKGGTLLTSPLGTEGQKTSGNNTLGGGNGKTKTLLGS